MTHTLERDREKGLIRLRHLGRVGGKEIWESHSSLLGLLAGVSGPRIIVDMQMTDLEISKYEGYEFSVSIARQLPSDARVALVKRPNGAHDSDFMFMKTVCERHGLRMDIFNDPASAERWLLEG